MQVLDQNLTKSELESLEVMHEVQDLIDNSNKSAAVQLAKGFVKRKIPEFPKLSKREAGIVDYLFHLHQTLTYPLLLNSTLSDLPLNNWSVPHCYEEKQLYTPPAIGKMTESVGSILLVSSNYTNFHGIRKIP